jgi:hypothetical protein
MVNTWPMPSKNEDRQTLGPLTVNQVLRSD